MVFLSAPFLFGFMPASLAGFFLLRRFAPGWSVPFLVGMSLAFLAATSALSLAVIVVSICVNRACASAMAAYPRERTAILALGIAANIASVAWFKINPVTLSDTGSLFLVAGMPLGLSFYAFKQITYLIDRHEGRTPDAPLPQYLLFSTFFAHLPAGPITPYRGLQPQLAALSRQKIDTGCLMAALALVIIGAFKLRFFAGQISALTVPIYAAAADGTAACLPEAVVASFGFLLELYYNFSGYSDIAIGLALFFGLRLSPNFDSPLKAHRLGDYVMRWHMSFMLFARDYFFVHVQKALSRALPFQSAVRRRLAAWIISVCATFVLVMLWHTANWTAFAISVVTAGAVIAAALLRLRGRDSAGAPGRLARLGGVATCVGFASVTIVFFRSGDATSALTVLAGFADMRGLTMFFTEQAPTMETCPTLSATPDHMIVAAILVLAAAIAFAAPNTSRMFGFLPQPEGRAVFRPTLHWALFLGLIAWLAWLSDSPIPGGVIYAAF
ncbi:MBOAT family O-acyltransferase [Meridianimarinicoccus sp. RP-17]|uniref:MBOAT family O-acyltransferase n=1 Tax=Meridianimarinicoccus zhengii TaxID=2056810 RepID=UPI000DABD361|nr:MBOAT family O-acyltransferase [Phycocomes zhengii]